MRIIITEDQLKILYEQQGLDEFTVKISETFPDSVYALDFIVNFIRNSECQKINFAQLRHSVGGISLINGVTLNISVLHMSFSQFLYVLFHEVAHQYQYKKYGIDKMYGCYTGEISILDGARWMQQIEKIADEFAIRKLKEIKRHLDGRVKINIGGKVYDSIPLEHFTHLISLFIGEIKKQGYKNKEDIGEILFNYIKV